MTLTDLGQHAGFIIAAYALFFIALGGMIAWVLLDGRAQARILRDLDARGIRRRSADHAPSRPVSPSKDDA